MSTSDSTTTITTTTTTTTNNTTNTTTNTTDNTSFSIVEGADITQQTMTFIQSLCNDDKIISRELNEQNLPVPQFKMILTCNTLPHISCVDNVDSIDCVDNVDSIDSIDSNDCVNNVNSIFTKPDSENILSDTNTDLKLKQNKLNLTQLPDDNPTYIAHEEKYVKLWNVDTDENLYRCMLRKNKDCPKFEQLDGPPFVSGNLHPGHIAVGSFKSALFNYKIMDGYNCCVKLGYDCHGLPALNKTAEENNLTIEEFKALSHAESNALCEKMIFKYKNSWKPLIQRIGRLADFEDDYMTRNPEFMESCWWVFKQIFDKGHIYKGEKVMPYSYGNQTPLSNFEASSNYKEKNTKSIYVGFELDDVNDNQTNETNETNKIKNKTYVVAWTTTPWTLPANLALCVNADLTYVKFRVIDEKKTTSTISNDNMYIMSKACIENLFGKNTKIDILCEMKGCELVNMTYKPIFPFTEKIDSNNNINRVYKIVADTYVTNGSIGSGIVHLAPAFGDDDFRVCFANNLIDNTTVASYCPIDEFGRFLDIIEPYKGRLVFSCEDDIRADLKSLGKLFKTQLYTHNYPYCWRTNTPLIYRTNPSYYIRVTDFKNRMIELNKTVNWYPSFIGTERFNNWLRDIKDWSVSRSTSYATPIPIWRSDDGSEICVGSIDELEELTGIKISNLHPEYVNDILIEKNGKIYKRISDTFDCWFESGAVPMAQCHYPFNEASKELETKEYLSDFICEGLDQTRGWFYTLLVLSTVIFDKAPYRNVLCTGMILDANGDKFSKRLGNYVDPQISLSTYGADIIRTFFINSPVMNADVLKFNDDNILFLKRRFTPYINGVKFWIENTINFIKQKDIETIDLAPSKNIYKITNLFDRWIIVRTNKLVENVKTLMDNYRFSSAIELLLEYIDELANWYIKFNRDRIKGVISEQDRLESIYVLYNVLMTYCRLWAPFTPFMSEHIYQHLRYCSSEFSSINSVLLTDYPRVVTNMNDNQNNVNNEILTMFKDLQRIWTLIRILREKSARHKKFIVPLKSCTIYHDDSKYLDILKNNIGLIQDKLNCQKIIFELLKTNVTVKMDPDRKAVGIFFRKEASHVMKVLESQNGDTLLDVYNGKTELKYTSSSFDEILDQRFYKLIKIPHSTIENTLCLIDNDIMVSIDCTYDEDIHNNYQNRSLYAAVQKCRKHMKLRPRHKVTVILDDRYATDIMKSTLQNSLNNTNVIIGDFCDDSMYSTLNGIHEDDSHLVYGQKFELETLTNTSTITGRIVVHHFKKSDNE